MLRYVLPFFLGLGGIAFARSANCDNYPACQSNLNIALNISDLQPWFSPAEFRNRVEQYYQENGTLGIRTVCKAFRQFKECMGDEYSHCISPGYLVTNSVPIFETYQFVGFFNQMKYVCGGGFQIYLSNDDCMSKAWSGSSGDQLKDCRYKFEKSSDASPSGSQEICHMAKNYLACFEQQFMEACGQNSRDTQFWGCEYARVNVYTRFPHCNVNCVLPHPSEITA